MTSTKRCSSSYSRETLSLIENVMNKARLSNRQKLEIINHLKEGKPIPILSSSKSSRADTTKKEAKFPTRRAKRRRKEIIIQSGAYEAEIYKPKGDIVDREKEKKKLQDIFWGLNQIPEDDIENTEKSRFHHQTEIDFNPYDRINELMAEIQDRLEFLSEMEKLGMKKKYHFEISNEISQKLKQLEDLSKHVQTKKTKNI